MKEVKQRLMRGKWAVKYSASRRRRKTIRYTRIFKRGRPTWWVMVQEVEWDYRRHG